MAQSQRHLRSVSKKDFGELGDICAALARKTSESLGDDFLTTVGKTSMGVMGSALTMGIGDGLGLMFPAGYFSFNSPVLTGAINDTFGGMLSGFITTSLLTKDINEGYQRRS